jgi:isopenicillin-N N-acyltransferase-like protein
LLSIAGCLGMTGMNADGVGVCINNLRSLDARVGVVWSALVRRMLYERHASTAHRVLMRAPMSSGHHYLIADAREAFGVETSGRKKELVFEARFDEDPRASFVHTNHCVGVEVAAVSEVSPVSTTKERYASLCESLVRAPIAARSP